jgi:hypothetical protein
MMHVPAELCPAKWRHEPLSCLSGVRQPDRSVSRPDGPVDYPESVIGSGNGIVVGGVHPDVCCADPFVTPSQLQPLELFWSWLTAIILMITGAQSC